MELTKDVILRGTAWAKAADNLSGIFKTRPHYMLFMLSISKASINDISARAIVMLDKLQRVLYRQ